MRNKKIYLFIGTTAELIKLVPVIAELNYRNIKFTIIASGQNDIHFEEFATSIGKPKILYAVTPKAKDPSLILFSFWAIRTFFSLLQGMRSHFANLNKSNSLFIVHGDTVSSLMGSLVAWKYGLKLIHIESGLRSFNFLEPFPEELCRYIISRLADVNFCPNAWAVNNLMSVKGEKINTYQNTLIETFWDAIKIKSHHPLIRQMKSLQKKYFVLVVHRQEHVFFGQNNTIDTLQYVFGVVPKKMQCIFLVHDISATFIHTLAKATSQETANRIMRVERLAYGDFMNLLSGSEFMVTDGGSNQEELYYMGKPCLLIRFRTERREGLNENTVLSKNEKNVIKKFIENYKLYIRQPVHIDIRPSKIIVDNLLAYEK